MRTPTSSMLARAVPTFSLAQKTFCWSGFGVRSTADAQRDMAPHRHSFFQVFFVAAGTAMHEMGGRTLHMRSGSIFFVPPYMVHRVVFPVDAECYVIYFSAHFIHQHSALPDDAALQNPDLPRLPELAPFYFQQHCNYQLDPAETAEARSHCLRMLEASTRRGVFDAARARAELTLLLTLVAAKYLPDFQQLERDGAAPSLIDRRARAAVAFLAQNFQRNIALDQVAAEVHLTGTYLTQLLKQETGKTYKQLLDELRLEHSKQLLAYTDISMLKVAEDSGFLDQVHFIKRFKLYTGLTPGQYRRLHHAPLREQAA
ncbi:helix-turn-helix transcriptional regulator [Bordetella bronchiseptica]|uniref:helix-turn-helix transcriptional regulator n=2 Tax=Bordetella bronchiseptica TaxID=518 RepID=UPI001E51FD1B|nr:AraC family transcriptional regulator [Bordetella bronchiseptica]